MRSFRRKWSFSELHFFLCFLILEVIFFSFFEKMVRCAGNFIYILTFCECKQQACARNFYNKSAVDNRVRFQLELWKQMTLFLRTLILYYIIDYSTETPRIVAVFVDVYNSRRAQSASYVDLSMSNS